MDDDAAEPHQDQDQDQDHEYDYLRRLDAGWYRGAVIVHWSMSIDRRRMDWLTEKNHSRFREASLHTLGRYDLSCPVYCLMPDHLHLLWVGLDDSKSDQPLAASFFGESGMRCCRKKGFSYKSMATTTSYGKKNVTKKLLVNLATTSSPTPNGRDASIALQTGPTLARLS